MKYGMSYFESVVQPKSVEELKNYFGRIVKKY